VQARPAGSWNVNRTSVPGRSRATIPSITGCIMPGKRRPDLRERAINLRCKQKLGRNEIARCLGGLVSPVTVGRWLRNHPLRKNEERRVRETAIKKRRPRQPKQPRVHCEVCGKKCSRGAKRFCSDCAVGRVRSPRREPTQRYLVEDRLVNSTRLKTRLIEEGYLEDRCGKCGSLPEWNGEPLNLQLDHIDGNRRNNLLSNLRIVCPNCHSQTPTYAARNRRNPKRSRRKPRYAHE